MNYFLVTGCGRSGTRYTADLLTELEIPTSWEGTMNPMVTPEHRARDYVHILRKRGLRGDSNWLAVPYLKRIPRNVIVFHQTRHPLKVIRSFMALRFFGDDYLRCGWRGDPKHTILPVAHLPGLRDWPTAIERCMDYWVRWNQLCNRLCLERGFVYQRYRFEDLNDLRTRKLEDVLSAIGGVMPPIRILWPNNKSRWFGTKEGGEFTWDDLPHGSLKNEVRHLATEYGYPGKDSKDYPK